VEVSELARLLDWFGRYSALAWTTHRSTPAKPRYRFVVELGRPASRDECDRLGTELIGDLVRDFGDAVFIDDCTFRPEQPVFLPPSGVVVTRLIGKPLDVSAHRSGAADTEEAHKTTEVILRGLPLSSVSLTSSSVNPTALAERYQPAKRGDRNHRLFDLARYLRGIAPTADPRDFRHVVREWHSLALAVIGTEDFGETWSDFLRGWDNVKMAFGEVMNAIAAKAEVADLPPGIEGLLYGVTGNRLVRLCEALAAHQQAEHDGDPLFLSCRQAAELLGISHTAAAKLFKALVADRVLELVKLGRGYTASRYHYVWQGDQRKEQEKPHGRSSAKIADRAAEMADLESA
jgi:hypothetical protein